MSDPTKLPDYTDANALEDRIALRVIQTLFDAGYDLAVYDGADTTTLFNARKPASVLAAMRSSDEEHLLVYQGGKSIGWITLAWGCDLDLIADNTVNLDAVLKPVEIWVETLA